MDKLFQDMDYSERVAWARGYILISIGEGKFDRAVELVVNQCHMYPLKKYVRR